VVWRWASPRRCCAGTPPADRELPRPEEDPVRRPATPVMLAVGSDHGAERSEAHEKSNGQPRVHEAVVNDQIQRPESGHSGADAESGVVPEAGAHATPRDDEYDRDGCMEPAQRVVSFEPPRPTRVVGAMNPPQRTVPREAMKERCPEVHRGRYRESQDTSDRDVSRKSHGARPILKPRRNRTHARRKRSAESTSCITSASRPSRREATSVRA
jgi:hypothetical protein